MDERWGSRHKLYRLEVKVGQDIDGKADWFNYPTSYAVLCDKRFPAVMEELDVATKGNPWSLSVVNFDEPSDETDAAIYSETCHGSPDAWRGSGFNELNGNLRVAAKYEFSFVELEKPEDVFQFILKPSSDSSHPIDQKWLIGSWRSPMAEDPASHLIPSCETDGIVTFKPDGSFSDGGSYGRYSLKVDKLTYYDIVLYDQAAPEGEEESFSEFDNPVTYTIERLGNNRMLEDGDEMTRCISGE